jgi:hypothetical protein
MQRNLYRCHRAHRRPSFHPHVEALETRDTPSTVVLDVVPNPATVGQGVTLTATITGDAFQPGTGAPTVGTVTFLDGAAALMTVTVTPKAGTTTQGVAQFSTSGLGVGTHSLSAKYPTETFSIPGGELFVNYPSTSTAVSETINPLPPPVPADMTARVSVAVHRGLPRGQQLVTVTNISGQAISGPLYLMFTKLPRRVRLKGASGATQAHNPFLLDAVTLLPGGYANFLASFTGNKPVRFTAAVFAGAGTV